MNIDLLKVEGHDESEYKAHHRRKYEAIKGIFVGLRPGKVLDIGIGTGNFYELLPFPVDVVGVDINEEFINVLNKRGIKAVRCDVTKEDLPFKSREFDLVMCDSVLEHTLTPKHLFSEIRRVLKPDGSCIIVVPNATSAIRRLHMLRGRSIFWPLINNLFERSYLLRCSVFYSPEDLRWALSGFMKIEKMSFIDETSYDPKSVAWKLARLVGRFKPEMRDVIIVVGVMGGPRA